MIFDGHTDIFTDLTRKRLSGEKSSILQDVHMKKLEKGGIQGGIFVVWPDPPHDITPYERTIEILKSIQVEKERHHDNIQWVNSYEDIEYGLKNNKFLLMIGFEGLSSIGRDIDKINTFYECGGRHASLTWNEQNALATGWNGDVNRGLTDYGKQAIERLESLKMIVDVSHANDKTFWDIANLVTRPIIASHSNSRELCNNRRNLNDDQLKFIKSTGGLVGINAFNEFIHENDKKQDLKHLANHIDYMVSLIGIDHVACGFDFCDFLENDALGSFSSNTNAITKNFEDATQANNLFKELTSRGYKTEDLQKIAYKNYFNLFKKIL